MDEIRKYEKYEGSELNSVKELLAFEVTKLIHSVEDAVQARYTAKALFSGAADVDTMPFISIELSDFADGAIAVTELLISAKLCSSKGDARRVIEQGGVSVDDEKVKTPFEFVAVSQFDKGFVVLKRGKKQFIKIILN